MFSLNYEEHYGVFHLHAPHIIFTLLINAKLMSMRFHTRSSLRISQVKWEESKEKEVLLDFRLAVYTSINTWYARALHAQLEQYWRAASEWMNDGNIIFSCNHICLLIHSILLVPFRGENAVTFNLHLESFTGKRRSRDVQNEIYSCELFRTHTKYNFQRKTFEILNYIFAKQIQEH